MSNEIKFEDFSEQVQDALEEHINIALETVASELQSQVQRKTPRDTGQLVGSWSHVVDESKHEATIGSPLEYAIWVEFGTGEHALEGNGRKGGWFYKDSKGEGHFTRGNKPVRMLHNAFEENKNKLIKIFENELKRLGR